MGDGKGPVRFSGRQIAIAHLVVPFTAAVPVIHELIGKIRDEGDDDQVFRTSYGPRVIQLAGPVDIALSIEIPTFRRIFQYNTLLSEQHVSCQWILVRELELLPEWQVRAPTDVDLAEEDISHCFFTHLRVYRQAYEAECRHTESQVVELIASTLSRHDIPATISVGLGWSDLVIHGLLRDPDTYCQFIADLQSQTIELGSEQFLPFQRTVSLMGYLWNDGPALNPSLARAKPLRAQTFSFRVAPGRLPTAFRQVRDFLEGLVQPSEAGDHDNGDDHDSSSDRVFKLELTTGKSDILATPRSKVSLANIHLDKEVRPALTALRDAGVESIETHVQTLNPEWLLERYRPPEQIATFQDMPLERLTQDFLEVGQRLATMPSGIRESISALYALFNCLLQDPSQRHDLARVIENSHQALLEPLDEMRHLRESTGFAAQLSTEDRLEILNRVLEELRVWCSRTEKILSERSESFQEIFSRTSRLSSFRGSVQTDLITADYLLEEYYDQLGRRVRGVDGIKRSVFHYGATDTIESQLKGGLVTTIPSKYLFSLPLAIPQLWMEASVRAFNHLQERDDKRQLRRRVQSFLDAERRTSREHGDGIRLMTGNEVASFIADLFGDLCVCFIGFDSFGDFLHFLVTLALRSPSNLQGDEGVRSTHWEDILQRLLFVRECEMLMIRRGQRAGRGEDLEYAARVLPERPDVSSAETITDEALSDFLGRRIGELVRQIRKIMRDDDRHRPERGAPLLGFHPEDTAENSAIWTQIARSVWRRRCDVGYQICHQQYLWDFLERYTKPREELTSPLFRSKVNEMKGGKVVDLSVEPSLNAFMREGYLAELYDFRLRDGQPNPRGMAALERSIYLAALKKFRQDED